MNYQKVKLESFDFLSGQVHWQDKFIVFDKVLQGRI